MSFITVLFCLKATATNYYIAPSGTGNDANNGTSSGTHKLTLASVFSTYNLGTSYKIYVATGRYTEKNNLFGSDDEVFTIEETALYASGNLTLIFDSDQTNIWLRVISDNKINKPLKFQIISYHHK